MNLFGLIVTKALVSFISISWILILREEAPTAIEEHINMELFNVIELSNVSSVNPDDVSNTPHYWQVFKPLCIDKNHSKDGIPWVLRLVESWVNNFGCANIFPLVSLIWIRRIDYNSVEVELFLRIHWGIFKAGIGITLSLWMGLWSKEWVPFSKLGLIAAVLNFQLTLAGYFNILIITNNHKRGKVED